MRLNKTARVKAPGGKHKMRGSGKAPHMERGFEPKDKNKKTGARERRLADKQM